MQMNSDFTRGLRLAAVVLIVIGFGSAAFGCSEHFDRRDTLTRASGDAVAFNIVAQSTSPWPPGSGRRRHDTSGRRLQNAMDDYFGSSKVKEPLAGPVEPSEGSSTEPAEGASSGAAP